MPNYPSSRGNEAPYDRGPQNNAHMLWDIRNRLLRHNLINIDRIISTNVAMSGYSGSGIQQSNIMFGSNATVQGQAIGFASFGVTHGHVVALVSQTDAKQNGLYRYESGSVLLGPAGHPFAATGSTGPSLVRLQSLTQTGVAIRADQDANAANFLNNLWYFTGSVFGHTGSLATGPNTVMSLRDAAGILYPQGFMAISGATTDGSGTSNANKIVYFTQEDWVTVGTDGVTFSTPQSVSPVLPSSRTSEGTPNLGYGSSTMEDFFKTARVMAELLDLINEFRDGDTSLEMNLEKRDYLANSMSGKIKTIQGQLEMALPSIYELYHGMFELHSNYNRSTGSKYPTGRNRGYNVFRV